MTEITIPLSELMVCPKCEKSFRVRNPSGLEHQLHVFNYLRSSLKGEARFTDMKTATELSSEELFRALKSLIEKEVVEEIDDETFKGYRFTRLYLYGHNVSKAPTQDVVKAYLSESPTSGEEVNEQAKTLAEMAQNNPKEILQKITVVRNEDKELVEESIEEILLEEVPSTHPDARENVLKALLKKYPLETNPIQRQPPIVIDLSWTENEEDMTKSHVLHKRRLVHIAPNKRPMLQSHK